ncbi:hypothetical protein BDA99DRAFT_532339 [Phascolomyces articulosus]|uniref:Uncharacterized protein n=1 Tax=Phascolomyces articulosus TaxID=60185 RepID=A0AAD5KQE7_9FUNG|nr:hypothetical protein BDA99DRAFT_532339 [Phascolomyces articulosus]
MCGQKQQAKVFNTDLQNIEVFTEGSDQDCIRNEVLTPQSLKNDVKVLNNKRIDFILRLPAECIYRIISLLALEEKTKCSFYLKFMGNERFWKDTGHKNDKCTYGFIKTFEGFTSHDHLMMITVAHVERSVVFQLIEMFATRSRSGLSSLKGIRLKDFPTINDRILHSLVDIKTLSRISLCWLFGVSTEGINILIQKTGTLLKHLKN